MGELVALEEQRTAATVTTPIGFLLREELSSAREAADAGLLERATTRARVVPVAARADRVIELARTATNLRGGRV